MESSPNGIHRKLPVDSCVAAPLLCQDHCRYRCHSVPVRKRPRALRASISFGKESRAASRRRAIWEVFV